MIVALWTRMRLSGVLRFCCGFLPLDRSRTDISLKDPNTGWISASAPVIEEDCGRCVGLLRPDLSEGLQETLSFSPRSIQIVRVLPMPCTLFGLEP